MGLEKGPTEGGSGGKRGHSGMEHAVPTEELKESTKKHRRRDDKAKVVEQLKEGPSRRDNPNSE